MLKCGAPCSLEEPYQEKKGQARLDGNANVVCKQDTKNVALASILDVKLSQCS